MAQPKTPHHKRYRVVSGTTVVGEFDTLEDAVDSARKEAAKHGGTVNIMDQHDKEVGHAETDGRVIFDGPK